MRRLFIILLLFTSSLLAKSQYVIDTIIAVQLNGEIVKYIVRYPSAIFTIGDSIPFRSTVEKKQGIMSPLDLPISRATQTALNLTTPNYTLHSPIEGATVNLVKNSFNIIDLSTIKTSLILNFPPDPNDKDFIEVKFTLAVTTVTYTGGVIKGGYVAPIAGTTIKFSYVQSTNTWY